MPAPGDRSHGHGLEVAPCSRPAALRTPRQQRGRGGGNGAGGGAEEPRPAPACCGPEPEERARRAPRRSRAPPAATFPSSRGTRSGAAAPAVTYIPGRSDARWNAANQTGPERTAAGRRRLLRAGREGKTAPLLRPDAAFQPPCPRRGAACSGSEPLTDRGGKFPATPSAGGNPPGEAPGALEPGTAATCSPRAGPVRPEAGGGAGEKPNPGHPHGNALSPQA